MSQIRKDSGPDLVNAAFDVMSDGAWIVGLDGVIHHANESVLRVFAAKDRKDLVGHHVHEFVPCDDEKPCVICRSQLESQSYQANLESINLQNGQQLRLDMRLRPVYENKIPVGTLVIFMDTAEIWNRFQVLTKVSPQIYWESTPTGEVTYINPYWAEFTGVSVEETMGSGWHVAIHPDYQARMIECWLTAVRDTDHYEMEFPLRKVDGTYRWFSAKGRPMLDKRGNVECWVGACVDIHVQREEATRLQAVLDAVPVLVGVLALDGTILTSNAAALESVYDSVDNSKGKTFWKAEWWNAETQEKIRQGHSAALEGHPQRFDAAYTHAVEGKDLKGWVDLTIRPVRDEYGKIIQIAVSGYDITDRLAAEQKELLLQERLLLATEETGIGVWEIDPQTMHMWRTTSHDLLYGHSEMLSDTDSMSFMNQIHPDDRERINSTFAEFFATGSSLTFEYRVIWPDKSIHWMKTVGHATRASGQILRIFGTNYDITSQKQLHEELESAKLAAENADRAKSSFLANMSHEIRTPLGAILGFADLLKDPNLTDANHAKYLETIDRSGRSLTRIIDDILDLAKVESGKLVVEKVNFSFREILNDVLNMFAESVRVKEIYLNLELQPDVPEHLNGDPNRVRQILVNIVGNAVKFTGTGGITLSVMASIKPGAGFEIEMAVQDTGVGIPDEKRGRLFEPFSQADDSTSRKFGGSGLGLILSKRLAQAMDGDIVLGESEPGLGSRFIIRVMAGRSQPAALALRSPRMTSFRERIPSSPLKGLKVLAVDDSVDNRELICEILKAQGATVEIASDGREAVERGMAEEFDVILMDIQMPELDGYEATRSLRAQGYKKPIIALTAHAMIEERRKTAAAGCDGHLTKPIDIGELLHTIQSLRKNRATA